MRFCLTSSQQQAFNAYFVQAQIQFLDYHTLPHSNAPQHFAQAQIQFLALYGDDYIATVRHLGLITFRISMILTVLRLMETNKFVSLLICSDTDFNTALEMVKILVQHAARVFDALPADSATDNRQPKISIIAGITATI